MQTLTSPIWSEPKSVFSQKAFWTPRNQERREENALGRTRCLLEASAWRSLTLCHSGGQHSSHVDSSEVFFHTCDDSRMLLWKQVDIFHFCLYLIDFEVPVFQTGGCSFCSGGSVQILVGPFHKQWNVSLLVWWSEVGYSGLMQGLIPGPNSGFDTSSS